MEKHHAINGKTHYFYGHGFNSKLLVYQRVQSHQAPAWQRRDRAAEVSQLLALQALPFRPKVVATSGAAAQDGGALGVAWKKWLNSMVKWGLKWEKTQKTWWFLIWDFLIADCW